LKRHVIIDKVLYTAGYARSDNKARRLAAADIFSGGCLNSIADIKHTEIVV
jgi:hypothetical protein